MSISGKFLGCTINGTLVEGNFQWSARGAVDKLDATTGSTGGYTDTDDGCAEMTVNMRIRMDVSTGDVESVQESTRITNLRLYRKLGDPFPAVSIPLALVTDCEESTDVRGQDELNITAVNKGAYTRNNPEG